MILGGYGRPALRRPWREVAAPPLSTSNAVFWFRSSFECKISLLISLWPVLVILLRGQGIIQLVSFSTEAGFAVPGHLQWWSGLSQIRIQALNFSFYFFTQHVLRKQKHKKMPFLILSAPATLLGLSQASLGSQDITIDLVHLLFLSLLQKVQ